MSNPPESDSAFPETYLSEAVADPVVQSILDLFNREGLSSQQSRLMLQRVRDLIDTGELLARRTSH